MENSGLNPKATSFSYSGPLPGQQAPQGEAAPAEAQPAVPAAAPASAPPPSSSAVQQQGHQPRIPGAQEGYGHQVTYGQQVPLTPEQRMFYHQQWMRAQAYHHRMWQMRMQQMQMQQQAAHFTVQQGAPSPAIAHQPHQTKGTMVGGTMYFGGGPKGFPPNHPGSKQNVGVQPALPPDGKGEASPAPALATGAASADDNGGMPIQEHGLLFSFTEGKQAQPVFYGGGSKGFPPNHPGSKQNVGVQPALPSDGKGEASPAPALATGAASADDNAAKPIQEHGLKPQAKSDDADDGWGDIDDEFDEVDVQPAPAPAPAAASSSISPSVVPPKLAPADVEMAVLSPTQRRLRSDKHKAHIFQSIENCPLNDLPLYLDSLGGARELQSSMFAGKRPIMLSQSYQLNLTPALQIVLRRLIAAVEHQEANPDDPSNLCLADKIRLLNSLMNLVPLKSRNKDAINLRLRGRLIECMARFMLPLYPFDGLQEDQLVHPEFNHRSNQPLLRAVRRCQDDVITIAGSLSKLGMHRPEVQALFASITGQFEAVLNTHNSLYHIRMLHLQPLSRLGHSLCVQLAPVSEEDHESFANLKSFLMAFFDQMSYRDRQIKRCDRITQMMLLTVFKTGLCLADQDIRSTIPKPFKKHMFRTVQREIVSDYMEVERPQRLSSQSSLERHMTPILNKVLHRFVKWTDAQLSGGAEWETAGKKGKVDKTIPEYVELEPIFAPLTPDAVFRPLGLIFEFDGPIHKKSPGKDKFQVWFLEHQRFSTGSDETHNYRVVRLSYGQDWDVRTLEKRLKKLLKIRWIELGKPTLNLSSNKI